MNAHAIPVGVRPRFTIGFSRIYRLSSRIMNRWFITWAYTVRITATNPRAMNSSLRPNVILDCPDLRTSRGPGAGQIAVGQGCCSAFFYLLFASPRDSTRLNDYSHLRGFRRVGVERVELLIWLNMGLVSSAVNAEHGAGQGQANTRRDFT